MEFVEKTMRHDDACVGWTGTVRDVRSTGWVTVTWDGVGLRNDYLDKCKPTWVRHIKPALTSKYLEDRVAALEATVERLRKALGE